MAESFSLKDDLFNRETVSLLANGFERAGIFDAAPFVDDVMAGLTPLELKARIIFIAEVLAKYLPSEFDAAANAIEAALPSPLDPSLSDDDFGRFVYASLGVYVEHHGLEAHRDRSLDLLEALTQRFSMEFSIRAFLNRWPDETLARMTGWAQHDHYHVRRLASEGTRPKLPWGQKVGLNTDQTLPILTTLHADPTRFVTRSVANHLNDITKSDPDTVLSTMQDWRALGRQDPKELSWMERHALRGLVKAGHPGAMEFLGYSPDVAIEKTELSIAPNVLEIGSAGEISATFAAPKGGPLIVDYVIDFVKANGSHSPKVFKLKVLDAKAGVAVALKKKHLFKKGATTFTHFPGAHRLHLQINGRIVASCDFSLS